MPILLQFPRTDEDGLVRRNVFAAVPFTSLPLKDLLLSLFLCVTSVLGEILYMSESTDPGNDIALVVLFERLVGLLIMSGPLLLQLLQLELLWRTCF